MKKPQARDEKKAAEKKRYEAPTLQKRGRLPDVTEGQHGGLTVGGESPTPPP